MTDQPKHREEQPEDERASTLGAHLSRLLFEARELADMLTDIVESKTGKVDNWSRRVRDEIDEFRKAHGWSPHGFGGEDDPGDQWYLAFCVQCNGGLDKLSNAEDSSPMPFWSKTKRIEWVEQHMDGTGHSVLLMDQPRTNDERDTNDGTTE